MHHILVPTDFSVAADNALEYARLLAREFSATVTLAYVHSMPMDPMELGEVSAKLYQEGETAITKRAQQLRAVGLAVHTDVQLGMPAARLKSIIHKQDIDLIVMGCQGQHYLPEKFFGSTTTDLMAEVIVPIIAVPSHFTPKFPQHIMWATDRCPPRRAETLYPLFELVDRATTELRVFHYQESGESLLPKREFKELLLAVRHDYFYQLADGDSADRAIQQFVQSSGIDLIALIHRSSTWLSRMILSSHARRMVWTSPVPVMILQEKQSL